MTLATGQDPLGFVDDETLKQILPDSLKAVHVVENFVVFEKKR